jgi:hypothetical protein
MAGNRSRSPRRKSPLATRIFYVLALLVALSMVLAALAPAFAGRLGP